MSGKIRDIEEIENLPEDVQLVPFAEPNDLAEPNVCGEESIAELEIVGEIHSWNHLTCRSASGGQAAVVVINQASQISLAQTPIQFVPLRPRQQIVNGSVSVEINPGNLCTERRLTKKGRD